jgi:hypothetical protein
VPSYSVGMRVSFDSIGEASAVVQETLAAGIQVHILIAYIYVSCSIYVYICTHIDDV